MFVRALSAPPMVMRDIPEYDSPVTGKPITSRSHRREDLKKHGCVEVDPPKRKRGLINPKFAKKHGARVCEETAERYPKPKRIDPVKAQKALDVKVYGEMS